MQYNFAPAKKFAHPVKKPRAIDKGRSTTDFKLVNPTVTTSFPWFRTNRFVIEPVHCELYSP
jgi:hypothetical protein